MISISLNSLISTMLLIYLNYNAEITVDNKPVSKTKITILLIGIELIAIAINSAIATFS